MGLSRTHRARQAKDPRPELGEAYGIKTLDTGAYRPVPKDYESRMSNKLKATLEVGQLKADNKSKMKETCAALATEPDNVRYGGMRMSA